MIITGVGRIGADVEVRYIPSGEAVANVRLAFNYGKKDSDGKQPTQWLDLSLWGKRAESLAPHLTKGTMISITAEEPHIESYEGKNGTGHKIVARILTLDFAGSKQTSDNQSQPRQQPPAQQSQQQRPAQSHGGGSGGAFDGFDDDIPFMTNASFFDTQSRLSRRLGRYA